MNYFSGLKVGYQSERLFAWILPASGAPFVVCPAFEEGRVREGLTMAPDGAATKIHTWSEDASPYDLVARSLKGSRGLADRERMGIEERTQFAFADGMMTRDTSAEGGEWDADYGGLPDGRSLRRSWR